MAEAIRDWNRTKNAGNNYEDQSDWMHTGPSHGWQIDEGKFVAAEGRYPNLTDPVWQKVQNETT